MAKTLLSTVRVRHWCYRHAKFMPTISQWFWNCITDSYWRTMTFEVEIHLHDLLQQPSTGSETEEISFPGCHFSLCIGGHLSARLTLVWIQLFDINESTRGDIVKKVLWDFNTFSSPSGYPYSLRSPVIAFKTGSMLTWTMLSRSGGPALHCTVCALTAGCRSKKSSYYMTNEGCRVH